MKMIALAFCKFYIVVSQLNRIISHRNTIVNNLLQFCFISCNISARGDNMPARKVSDDFAASFSRRLTALRERNRYTQAAVAAGVGVAASSIGYYEKGEKIPNAEILAKLCQFYHVPADYLLGFTDDAGVADLPEGPTKDDASRLLDEVAMLIARESRVDYDRNILGPVADIIERIGGLIADADESFAELREKYPAFSRSDPYGSMGADIKSLTEAMLGLSKMPEGLEQFLTEYRERSLDVTRVARDDIHFIRQRVEVAICKALTGGFTEHVENVRGGGGNGNSHKAGK